MSEHERTRERIEEYLDEALTPADEEELEAHLAVCRTCRDDVAGALRVRRLARQVPPVAVPEDLGDRIRRMLPTPGLPTPGAGKVLPLRRDRAAPIFAVLAAAAAALLIAVVGTLTGEAPERPVVVAGLRRPTAAPPAVTDWIVQAVNASPEDAAFLIEEARASGLLDGVRTELARARGAEREYLQKAEDLLILLQSRPSPEDFLSGAKLVAMARPR